jgi:hypothetical protein
MLVQMISNIGCIFLHTTMCDNDYVDYVCDTTTDDGKIHIKNKFTRINERGQLEQPQLITQPQLQFTNYYAPPDYHEVQQHQQQQLILSPHSPATANPQPSNSVLRQPHIVPIPPHMVQMNQYTYSQLPFTSNLLPPQHLLGSAPLPRQMVHNTIVPPQPPKQQPVSATLTITPSVAQKPSTTPPSTPVTPLSAKSYLPPISSLFGSAPPSYSTSSTDTKSQTGAVQAPPVTTTNQIVLDPTENVFYRSIPPYSSSSNWNM